MSAQKDQAGTKSGEAADLIDKGGAEFLAGHMKSAEGVFAEALDALKNKPAGNAEVKAQLAAAHQGLGRAKTWLAKYREAEQHLSEAAKLIEDLHGEDSSETRINNLYRAELCEYMEEYEKAHLIASNVVSELKQASSTGDLLFAHALARLGMAMNHLKQGSEAEPLLSKALGIRKGILGDNHRLVAESLHDLAHSYQVVDNFTLASVFERRALKIREEVLGEDHPEVGTSLYALASQYLRSGLFSKAEAAARRGLKICQNSFDNDHPLVIRLCEELASACLATGMIDEAEKLNKSALKSAETRWGIENPRLVASLVGLGTTYLSRGDWRNAETYFEKSLKIMESNEDLNTSLEYRLLQQLSCCYLFQFKLGDAIRLVPDTFRAKHTSDFSSTIDLIRKLVEFASKKLDQSGKKD